MHFNEKNLYHIYNRGNNGQNIFYNRENYLYFLRKVRKYISPVCDILNWSLMPNHFHFFIHANENSCKIIREIPMKISALSDGFRLLLSSYSKAIKKQTGIKGNVFQQKTKAKCIDDGEPGYANDLFHYIHQNAWKAKIVEKMEDWEFCSFPGYAGFRKDTLCNFELAKKLLKINFETFYEDSYMILEERDWDK